MFSFSQTPEFSKWNHFFKNSTDTLIYNIEYKNQYYIVSNYADFKQCNQLENNDKIVRVLDENFFIIKTSEEHLSQYSNINYKPVNNLWKLGSFEIEGEDEVANFVIKVNNASKVEGELKALSIEIILKHENSIVINANYATIEKFVLPLDEVIYVSKENFKPKQESNVNDLDLSVNGFESATLNYSNLFNLSTVVGLKDNYPFEDDLDLVEKIASSTLGSAVQDSHATDMATIIVGLGNSGKDGQGVLLNTQIFPIDYNNLYPSSTEELLLNNVNSINNSFGTSIENFYGDLAYEYDKFINESEVILPVFSSGNSGLETPEGGSYAGITGYANLTGNFKMAKNCLTVGAVDYFNTVMPFSSKGPAYDGRIKPEIVAYSQIGTSNATALVTAAAALLQQAYFNENGFLPTSDLVKGLLLNAADDIENPGIDFKAGFGNLNINESIKILENEHFFQDILSANESKAFEIIIPENVTNIKVMLIWNDIEANPNDNLALKNDLDLTVNIGEQVVFPQILDASSTIESLEAQATTGEDHLNNVEQVVIESGAAETLTINVQANELLSENQLFSVLYTWDLNDEFEWVFPVENSNFPYNGGVTGTVKWNSTFQNVDTGTLEVSYDEGTTWQVLSNELEISEEFFEWNIEEDTHTRAQLRFLIGDEQYVSDAFTISSGTQLSTTLNCDEINEIAWSKKENISTYNIYSLQNNELQFVATTPDTTYAFTETIDETNFFAVKPQLLTGEETLVSRTLNFEAVGELCYIDFIIGAFVDDTVEITTSLSSLYTIETVELVRTFGGEAVVVDTLENIDSLNFILEDATANEGFNTYQVRVITENGEAYYSNEVELYVFKNAPYFVYPNPTTAIQGFNVLINSENFDQVNFQMYSINGVLQYEENFNSTNFYIDALTMQSGIYICKISFEGKEATQKLILK